MKASSQRLNVSTSQRSAWFFDDPEPCDKLKREAIEWLVPPTPFREFSMAKGRGGGVDCLGLAQRLHEAAGVVRRDHFKFQRLASDYQSASRWPKVLDYLRGRVPDDPQSAELAAIYSEIQLPRDKKQIPLEILRPGDFAIMRDGGQFHFAIIIEGRHMVSALPERGVVEGELHDFNYAKYLIALFRARASSQRLNLSTSQRSL